MSALAIAFDLAAQGLSVFPCGHNKMPCIPKKAGGRGFLDATCDPATIRRMFDRRSAVLVGVPTGDASGFDALDIDPRHGGDVWVRDNVLRLPETRMHQTQSGGRHWLFHHAPGVRNSASKKGLAPGIDVRGEGGYIIMPPSPGYRIISDAAIAHWPDWLLALALPPPEKPRPAASQGPREPIPQGRLQAIRDRALDRVRSAPDGGKHFVVRNMALLLGGIASDAGFTDDTAVQWLLNALPSSVKDRNAAQKTAQWGLENGRRNPVDLRDAQDHPKPGDPRRKETASLAFRMLRRGMTDAGVIATLHARNRARPEPLPDHDITATARWAIGQMRERAHAP